MAEMICNRCNVALMYPHQNEFMAAKGWVKCTLCGFCKIIESHKIENRVKNQRGRKN